MAKFGPKIFHALAYMADADRNNTFKTESCPKKCGFDKTEPGRERKDGQGKEKIDVLETIETLKNAIFKTVMLRIRNQLYLSSLYGVKPKSCTVGLLYNVTNDFLQHDHDASDTDESEAERAENAELSELLNLKALTGGEHGIVPFLGGENNILPSIFIDKILEDCLECVQAAGRMQGVCARTITNVNDAFKDDEFYQLLPDF